MIVATGNEDKLYDARLAHILQLFRQAHPEIQLCELPVHGKRQNQMVEDSLDFLVRQFTRQIFSFTSYPFLYFVILRLIFLHITYFYSFHCILRHMFY